MQDAGGWMDRLVALLGRSNVLLPGDDPAPCTVDWRGRYRGEAPAVRRPGSTAELVRLSVGAGLAVVPRGDNPGLCGAAVPSGSTPAIVVRLFPWSLGAEGSCRIGGKIGTNAGGTAVLRDGPTREPVLGIGAVLPDGRAFNGLRALRKDDPGLVAIPAGWLGGDLSDRLYKNGWSLTRVRKTCLVGGLLASSVVALAALAPRAISSSGLAFAGANIGTLPGDVAPTPSHVASIGGIQNVASNLAGIALITFTGVMVGITKDSFVIPLAVAGCLSLVGAAADLFIVGEIAPLKARDDEGGEPAPALATGRA